MSLAKMAGRRNTKRAIKALFTVLTVLTVFAAFISCFVSNTTVSWAANENIVLPSGQKEFTVDFALRDIATAYGGADIDLTISDENLIDIKPGENGSPMVVFKVTDAISQTAAPRTLNGQKSYMFGFAANDGQNKFSGNQDVCTVTFVFNGAENTACDIALSNIRLHRFTGEVNKFGVPQYDNEVLEQEFLYHVSYGGGGTVIPSPDDDEDDDDPGGDDNPGGNDNPGEDNTPPGGNGGNATVLPGGGSDSAGGVADDGTDDNADVGIGDAEPPAGDTEVPDALVPFINGYPDGTFKPDNVLTRAEFAQILYNLYGGGETNESTYTDVTANHWAYDAIGFCQTSEYLIGYPDGGFRPEQVLTRAELSTAYARVKALELTDEQPFADVTGHWAIRFIGAAYGAEFIIGYPDGTFKPDNQVTRAETVTLICRAEGRNQERYDTAITFTDVSEAHWAYDYIMNAANGYTED